MNVKRAFEHQCQTLLIIPHSEGQASECSSNEQTVCVQLITFSVNCDSVNAQNNRNKKIYQCYTVLYYFTIVLYYFISTFNIEGNTVISNRGKSFSNNADSYPSYSDQ